MKLRLLAGICVLLLCSVAIFGQIQTINVGTAANDKTGDPLRTVFQKVNSNFTYLDANKVQTTLAEGANIATGTTTGSKIATSVSQKLGFWNATPIVQPAGASQAAVTLGNTDSEISGLTIGASYTQAEVQALRDKCEELADDLRALSTLVHAQRTALVNAGLIKGSN